MKVSVATPKKVKALTGRAWLSRKSGAPEYREPKSVCADRVPIHI